LVAITARRFPASTHRAAIDALIAESFTEQYGHKNSQISGFWTDWEGGRMCLVWRKGWLRRLTQMEWTLPKSNGRSRASALI
jgi:hypothetical protein